VVVIGVATDYRLASAHADCGAVARLWRLADAAVNLLQHRVINICSERIFNRAQISTMAVCGQLNAMRQAVCQIAHGSVTLQRGTKLAFISREGDEVRFRYLDADYKIPVSATDLK
jgi:hypothetical protein